MSTFAFVAGDTGSSLKLTCLDAATKTPIDLTGKTVTLRFQTPDGTVRTKTMTNASDPTTGVATYLFLGTELQAGTTRYESTVTDGGGLIVTSLDMATFLVRSHF